MILPWRFTAEILGDYGACGKETAARTEQMEAQHKGVYLEPTKDKDTSNLNKYGV